MKRFFAVLLVLCISIGTLGYTTALADETVVSDVLSAVSQNYLEQATEWALFDMAVNGMAQDLPQADVLNYYIESTTSAFTETRAINLAKTVIILTSLGYDATKITGEGGNLVSIVDKIASSDNIGGINGAIFSLIAYDSGNYIVEDGWTRDELINYILNAVKTDGGWSLTEDASEASDPDITAMVLWALAPYYDSYAAVIDNAVLCLSNMQQQDGQVASWGVKNSNSASAIIIALSALGIDADADERFVKNDVSILDALLSYKTSDNMFGYSDNNFNAMATEQGFRALVAYSKFKENGAYNIYKIDYENELPSQTKTVSLRIEGISENKLNAKSQTVTFNTQNITVADVVKSLVDAENYICQDLGYGEYFSSLYGEGEGTFNIDYDGWQYKVNGKMANVGVSNYYVNDNDEILLYYGGMSIAYPNEPTITCANKIAKIEFTYDKVIYGGAPDYAMTVVEEPIAGATVTVDGALEFVTDENGAIGIPYSKLKNGVYSLQISKTSSEGMPLVVRFDDDYEIEIKHPVYNTSSSSSSSSSSHSPSPSPAPSPAPTPAPTTPEKEEVKEEVVFTDVTDNHWAYSYINYLTEKGVINGKENNKFCPEDNITRGEFVTLLYRLSNEAITENNVVFNDVSADDWYFDAVMWAYNTKITNGVTENTFNPENNITREEMAVLTVRYLNYIEKTLESNDDGKEFADQQSISPWAVEAVVVLKNAQILNGDEAYNFNPINTATRAETAKILYLVIK